VNKPRAFVWGASGHAKVAADAALLGDSCSIVGFLDELHPDRRGEPLLGLSVLGGAEQLEGLRGDGVDHVILGVGDCDARLRIAEKAELFGFRLLTVVHPSAVLARDVRLGAGTLVAAGAVVNPSTQVGVAVILNTGCSLDHDCRIGAGAHISPGVRLAGNVTVGEASWIGIGSSVIQGITIGARAIVGAGSVVVRDLADSLIAFGVPARPQRRR
jgi:UDP-N-acetylbacillosamine N-acetyltransferase